MKKTAVIYWSGTGNTQAMAEAVLKGMQDAGAEAVILTPDQADASSINHDGHAIFRIKEDIGDPFPHTGDMFIDPPCI